VDSQAIGTAISFVLVGVNSTCKRASLTLVSTDSRFTGVRAAL
jgi:hypothetical protein